MYKLYTSTNTNLRSIQRRNGYALLVLDSRCDIGLVCGSPKIPVGGGVADVVVVVVRIVVVAGDDDSHP